MTPELFAGWATPADAFEEWRRISAGRPCDYSGITYERMRAKAVKLLGPTAVAIIEKVVEYVRALISGGTDEQKATWLPRIAAGEAIVALADHVITGEADLKFAEVCRVLLGDDEAAKAALPKVMPAGLLATLPLPVPRIDTPSVLLAGCTVQMRELCGRASVSGVLSVTRNSTLCVPLAGTV